MLPLLLTLAVETAPVGDPALAAKAAEIFDEWCTACHAEGGDPSDPSEFSLEGQADLAALVGRTAVEVDKPLISAGDPQNSYLMDKVLGTPVMKEDLMPLGDDPLSAEDIAVLSNWITSMKPADTAAAPPPGEAAGAVPPDSADAPPTAIATGLPAAPPKKKYKPFHGVKHIVLPTTTTLGKKGFQYRIDHRFGRIGTERGAFGLDAGVVMSMGIAYGILDGWDVQVRRTNSNKAWEFATKYIALRQENDAPVSLGGYVSMDVLADFADAIEERNRVSGNVMLLLSRLWMERWATMLSLGYHTGTNKSPSVSIDYGDGDGPVPVEDTRGTATVGLASQVWLGSRKRWSFDAEYVLPIPAGGTPEVFYRRGGDTGDGPSTQIGVWSVGGGYHTGKHFFQVFFTNNREIHPNLAAPGGQTTNPFRTEGVDGRTFLNELNFYLGFNLIRQFTLGKNIARWKKNKQK